MLCMTFFFCAPLQSAGGFILEGDWTPTKTNLLYSPPIEVGVLSTFKIKSAKDSFAENTTSEHRGIITTRLMIAMLIPKESPNPGITLFVFLVIVFIFLLFFIYRIKYSAIYKMFLCRLTPSIEVINIRQIDIGNNPFSIFRNCSNCLVIGSKLKLA